MNKTNLPLKSLTTSSLTFLTMFLRHTFQPLKHRLLNPEKKLQRLQLVYP